MNRYLLAIASLLLLSLGARAQVTVQNRDTMSTRAQELLEIGQTSIFSDARTPRFIMTDRTQKFLFGVGGYIAGKGYYDFTGFGGDGFYVDQFSAPFSALTPDKIGFNVSSSKLIFKLLGDTDYGVIEATFETDFGGPGGAMTLGRGYVRFGNFLIGQEWSLSKDAITSPNVIDGADPVATYGYKLPQVRYTFNPSQEVQLAFSLEFPTLYYIAGVDSYLISEFLPDFNARVILRPKGGSYIGQLSAMFRYMTPDPTVGVESLETHVPAFGVTTSHNFNFGGHSLYLSGAIGRGVSDMFAGTAAHYMNLYEHTTLSNAKYFHPYWIMGLVGAYSYNWNAKAQSNLVASILNTKDWELRPNTTPITALPKQQFSISANYIHELIPNMTIGAELLYGDASYSAGVDTHGVRLGFLYRYNF